MCSIFVMQELILCIIILLFLFISFILTAVYGWIDAAVGAVCVSSFVSGYLIFLFVYIVRIFCSSSHVVTLSE